MTMSDGNMSWGDIIGALTQQKEAESALAQSRWQDQLSESAADRSLRLKQITGTLQNERARIAIEKGTAAADKWYKEQQIQLAKDEAEFNKYKFNVSTGLDLYKTDLGSGLDVLKTQAGLTGPLYAAQAIDYAEGAQKLLPQSSFLTNLSQGRLANPYISGGATPTPATVGGLAAMDTSSLDALKARRDTDLGLADQIFRNPGSLAIGSLGDLGKDRLNYLLGLGGYRGYSTQNFLDAYGRQQPGQGSATAY
jgi:hypothetical protein